MSRELPLNAIKVSELECDLDCDLLHVKLTKFNRGRSSSLHLAKEEDFAQNNFAIFFLSKNIQILAD